MFGIAAAMLVLANLGLDPWNVLHQGLSRSFGLGIGTWVIIVSFVALLGWLPLPYRPGIGTLANAVLIGLVIDAVLALFHAPHGILARLALVIAGIGGMGVATGLYIGAGLGAGPRDGLSVGLVARGGYSMRVVRTSVEVTVLLCGWLLGGTVGLGTVLFAVCIGPITHLTIPALAIDHAQPALKRRAPADAP